MRSSASRGISSNFRLAANAARSRVALARSWIGLIASASVLMGMLAPPQALAQGKGESVKFQEHSLQPPAIKDEIRWQLLTV